MLSEVVTTSIKTTPLGDYDPERDKLVRCNSEDDCSGATKYCEGGGLFDGVGEARDIAVLDAPGKFIACTPLNPTTSDIADNVYAPDSDQGQALIDSHSNKRPLLKDAIKQGRVRLVYQPNKPTNSNIVEDEMKTLCQKKNPDGNVSKSRW